MGSPGLRQIVTLPPPCFRIGKGPLKTRSSENYVFSYFFNTGRDTNFLHRFLCKEEGKGAGLLPANGPAQNLEVYF